MINWIKRNKLSSALIVVIAFIVFSGIKSRLTPIGYVNTRASDSFSEMGMVSDTYAPSMMPTTSYPSYDGESTAKSDGPRMVITDNNASLVVKNVTEAKDQIISKTNEFGGFMVNVNVYRPEESANGIIKIRIPVQKAEEFNKYLDSIAVKVASFSTNGQDVTDQYTDLDSRLSVLNESYERIDAIYKNATTVEEMLKVQQQLFSLRDQIDSIKGQKKYIEDTTSTIAYTIYLSTDEYSLPYSPEGSWRPEVAYKLAVRSLVLNLRGLGNTAIWIGVYAIIWLPLLALGFVGYKIITRKKV